MMIKLLCFVLLVVAPSALCKSMSKAGPEAKLLQNQMSGGRPWYCVFDPEGEGCQYVEWKSEEGREAKLLQNQMSGGRPWYCVFDPEGAGCQRVEWKSEEGREEKLLQNQLSGARPWYCRFDPNGVGCQEVERKSEEGREDMPAPFGGSGAAQARDAHQDNFAGSLRTAARSLRTPATRAEVERTASPGARKVVTCVYCDNQCVARAAASGYASAKAYFDVTIGEMNRIVQGGLDENMSLELTFVLLPNSNTYMSWFFDYSATNSEELLTGINNNFWRESGLYNMSSSYGCDVDFLAAAPEDPGWNYMGSIEGIANMFQLCLGSYSTVQMSANPISLAKLMTHEFGHMLGIYHDGAVSPSFTGQVAYFEPGQMLEACKPEYEDLSAACTTGSVGCPSGKCIMAATVDGTDWSACSKSYYSMYNCLTGAMPTFYDASCVNV